MTLLRLLLTAWVILGTIGLSITIGMAIEDGIDGVKSAGLASLAVLLIYSFITTIIWFVTKGTMM